MNSERYALAKRLLLTARDLPPNQQREYLERECTDDTELLNEVWALLRQNAKTRGAFEVGAAVRMLGAEPGEPPDRSGHVPKTIGPYRIIDVLGSGGMGVVYRAEQTEPMQREVALKLVQKRFDVASVVARFELERQNLARMDHTNIARAFDAGTDADGNPFFVMELVRGDHITSFCETRGLDVRERLHMFRSVCRAVQHAHQKGVIHRDLKPSNILVAVEDGMPVPKIIDFGIAKAVEAEDPEQTAMTRAGSVIGTIGYMSPEQARGEIESLDTRTDVYSLGVVLYEVLTHERPFDVTTCPLHEAVQIICERSADRPSARAPELDPDLDTIVLKCIEKDPERRYGTASALADDIDRYLNQLPIHARPPSTTYQLRKLVQRNKLPFAFAGTLAVLLLVFGITMAALFASQRRERIRAEREALKANRINTAFVDMLQAANPWQSRRPNITVAELLDEASISTERELQHEPEVQATMQRTLGNAYQALGMHDKAEDRLRKALETAQSLARKNPELSVLVDDVSADLVVLFSNSDSHPDEAYELASRVLDNRLDRLPESDLRVARALNDKARAARRLKRFNEADSLDQRALALRMQHGVSVEIAESLMNQGSRAFSQGRLHEAEAKFRAAMKSVESSDGDEAILSISLALLATVLTDRGDYDQAEPYYLRALAIQDAILPEDDKLTAGTRRSYALLLANRGRNEEADAILTKAEAVLTRTFDEGHDEIINARAVRAFLLHGQSRFADAEALYRECWQRTRERHGDEHLMTASALHNLASVVHHQGRFAEAEPLYRQALRTREPLLGDHVDVAESLLGLGTVLLDRGALAEAEALLLRATRLFELADSWKAHWARDALAVCVARSGRRDEAELLFAQSEDACIDGPGAPLWKRRLLERNESVYDAWGDTARAEVLRRRMQAIANL